VWQQGSSWQSARGQTVHWPGQAVLGANHGDALRRAALAGAGIVLQPEVLLAEDLAAGRLQQVLPGTEPPSRPVHLLYPADRLRLPKLQAFITRSLARWGEAAQPPSTP
jgi:DNA-binding transcriptional LysR family regulator